MSRSLGRFYVATKLSNEAEHRQLARVIFATGGELTYDWTAHGSVQATPDRFGEVATKELNGVLTADAVVVILPGGSGTHVELGAALARNIPVVLVGAENEKRWGASYPSVFWHLPEVHHVMMVPGWEMMVMERLRQIRTNQAGIRNSQKAVSP